MLVAAAPILNYFQQMRRGSKCRIKWLGGLEEADGQMKFSGHPCQFTTFPNGSYEAASFSGLVSELALVISFKRTNV